MQFLPLNQTNKRLIHTLCFIQIITEQKKKKKQQKTAQK